MCTGPIITRLHFAPIPRFSHEQSFLIILGRICNDVTDRYSSASIDVAQTTTGNIDVFSHQISSSLTRVIRIRIINPLEKEKQYFQTF